MPKLSQNKLQNSPSINHAVDSKITSIDYQTAKNALTTIVYEAKFAFRKHQLENRTFQQQLSLKELQEFKRKYLNREEIVSKIETFLEKFDEMDFDISCYVYTSLLFQRVISKRK